ncbi:gamma-glutamyltransferase [Lederbergia sp. NSJ-179]|uniref:gamma-glutamyltransferase n=1 Tax=Lederbergia sp. NSJ-179 TaxID=2931402 RepID=UPI001FD301E4|nr:gamma-glutamyltransferase [Lederbergia sp. NSJ-179]MCJ7842806.1 gamma-glutamyltransferase [Lederbergia sp. NSJ-179]
MNTREIFLNQKIPDINREEQRAIGDFGMTASATKQSSEIGAQVLKNGGNAVDAIVAMQFALAVSEPFNTGLGASGFLLVYNQYSGKTKVINGHSKAPDQLTSDMCRNEKGEPIPFSERTINANFIGIPGILKAMETAFNTYGTMPLDRLIEPSVQLAEEGMEVNWLWDMALKMYGDRVGTTAKSFFFPDNVPLVKGEIVKNKELAHTLRIIQEKGIDAFYHGEIGDAIIQLINNENGCMSKEDLQGYESKIQEPILGSYKDFHIVTPSPPNGAGVSLLQLLKILEKVKIEQYPVNSWEKHYLLAEAMRIVFTDKLTYMGDPDFTHIPVEGLLHPEYIAERVKLINFEGLNQGVDFGNPWKYDKKGVQSEDSLHRELQGGETTHFTAVDSWGNIAVCTSSLEHYFGSGIMVPGYGFLLNNDLTDFYPTEESVNDLQANKYPVSSKCPTIIFKDEKPFMTLGSPGGPTIVASVAQVILHVIDYKMDLKEAIEQPRIYNSTAPTILCDGSLNEEVKSKLSSIGFEIIGTDIAIGNVQAVLMDQEKNIMYGAADSSRPGVAIGIFKENNEGY